MRARPIRSQIYLPVVRFGVRDTDWKFVIFTALLGYSIPFMFNLRFMRFPLEIWICPISLVAAVAFFNFVRIGRRPYWLQHQLTAISKPSRQRHALPTDKRDHSWLVTDQTD